jgi:hypothetical protein
LIKLIKSYASAVQATPAETREVVTKPIAGAVGLDNSMRASLYVFSNPNYVNQNTNSAVHTLVSGSARTAGQDLDQILKFDKIRTLLNDWYRLHKGGAHSANERWQLLQTNFILCAFYREV